MHYRYGFIYGSQLNIIQVSRLNSFLPWQKGEVIAYVLNKVIFLSDSLQTGGAEKAYLKWLLGYVVRQSKLVIAVFSAPDRKKESHLG